MTKNPNNIFSTLPADELSFIQNFSNLADKHNVDIYIVGGYVRDLILGRPNFDIDIMVKGDGVKFAQIAADQLNCTLDAQYSTFKTATLLFNKNRRVDIVTTRSETYPIPAGKPQISFNPKNISDDMFRRDFTINAIAAQIGKNNFGKVFDPFSGLKDIAKKRIRVLHKESFIDDPTRIFRAIRFAHRLGFTLDKPTEKYLNKAVRSNAISKISGMKIFRELKYQLQEQTPYKAIYCMEKCKILKLIYPKLYLDEKLFKQVDLLLLNPTIKKNSPPAWELYLYSLTRLIKHDELIELLTFFSVPKKNKRRLLSMKSLPSPDR